METGRLGGLYNTVALLASSISETSRGSICPVGATTIVSPLFHLLIVHRRRLLYPNTQATHFFNWTQEEKWSNRLLPLPVNWCDQASDNSLLFFKWTTFLCCLIHVSGTLKPAHFIVPKEIWASYPAIFVDISVHGHPSWGIIGRIERAIST